MKTVLGAWCVVLAAGAAMAELVEYRDYDANTGTFTNAVRECVLVTSAARTLENGWYLVEGTVRRGEIDVAAGGCMAPASVAVMPVWAERSSSTVAA